MGLVSRGEPPRELPASTKSWDTIYGSEAGTGVGQSDGRQSRTTDGIGGWVDMERGWIGTVGGGLNRVWEEFGSRLDAGEAK